jgi:anti-sigma factor RsiW
MIGCNEALEGIAELLSGEVEPSRQQDLEKHLEACATCSEEMSRTRSALDLLAQEDVPDPGPGYWAAYGGRLRRRLAASNARPRRLIAVAAAALLAAVLATYAVRRTGFLLPGPDRLTEGRLAQEAAPQPRRDDPAAARLRTLLEQAAAGDEGLSAAQVILDEIVPGDSLGFEDDVDALSVEERGRLARDLRGSRG